MMKNKHKKSPGKGQRFVVIIGAAAILAATAWAFYSPNPPRNPASDPMKLTGGTATVATSPATTSPNPSAATTPLSGLDGTEPSLLQPMPIQPTPSVRHRSPLEQSPGYYPPADPE